MKSPARVRLILDDPGVAVIELRDPAEKNALGHELVSELAALLASVSENPSSRVCVFRGSSDVFSSGGHPSMLRALARGEATPSDIPLLRAILDIPVPTVAAMEGHAVGGGLMLGLCADIVLMARESRYGCPFVDMGFTPGAGATRLLERAVGEYVAAEMLYGGEFFRGSHFEGRSGINHVLPREKVWPKALGIARRIAEKPRPVLEILKRQLATGKRLAFEEARAIEATMHQCCFADPKTAQRIEDGYLRPLGEPHE